VKRRLEEEWASVGRPKKVSLGTKNIFVAGARRGDIETYLRKSFAIRPHDGSLEADQDTLLKIALLALREVTKENFKPSEEFEMEVWSVPRFSHMRYGEKGEIGGKMDPAKIREAMDNLTALSETPKPNFLPPKK
jgi:hypothetical protein